MPYRIRWEGHGVYRRFFGMATAADFMDAHREISSDLRYEGIRYIISDFLEAEHCPDVTERDLANFAKLERLEFFSSPDIVNATVATDEKILADLRVFLSLGLSPYPHGVFATVAEARRWIASNPRLGWRREPPGTPAPATRASG